MANQEMLSALETQIRAIGEAVTEDRAARDKASATERDAIDKRMKVMEDAVRAFQAQKQEVERTMLPGVHPDKHDGKGGFSLSRCILALRDRDWSRAPYEREVYDNMQKRVMSAGTDSAGGFIVPEEAIPEIIERLKAEPVVFQMGARSIPATGAPLTIPRKSTSATAVWVAENATITPSDLAFQQVSMSPRSIASRILMSNTLLELSSPAADMVVRDDAVSEIGLAIDKGALEGTGAAGQPTGITLTSGINTSAATDAQILYTELVDFITALAVDNAYKGKLGWVFNPLMLGQIMKVANSASPAIDVERKVLTDGPGSMLMGYKWAMTSQLTGTAGVGANSIIFANWDDLMVAQWGGLRIDANRWGAGYASDQTDIRVVARVDVAVRQPLSFCVAS